MQAPLRDFFGGGQGAAPGKRAALPPDPAAAGDGGAPPAKRSRHGALAALALERLWGFDGFRGLQRPAIEATLEGRDVFLVMPTGGGKSLAFQLPAVLSPGVTLVISPLLSLIMDQVAALVDTRQRHGGIPAASVSSQTPITIKRQVQADLDLARRGMEPTLKLLYVTPETVVGQSSSRLLGTLQFLSAQGLLARIVVDEAHCVSEYGSDFRPDYGRLGLLRELFPSAPILAVTATAPPRVRSDIMGSLRMRSPAVLVDTFNRTNLHFRVDFKPQSSKNWMKQILDFICVADNGVRKFQTGIVYCMTQKSTSELADYLRDNGVKADYYHAGQGRTERERVQFRWLANETMVVCATIAYGMGIDKPDVRYVLHATLAKSIEGYYQEAGRAGRDGNPAECVIFYRPEDVSKVKNLILGPFGRGKRAKARGRKGRQLEQLEQMRAYCEAGGEAWKKGLKTTDMASEKRKKARGICRRKVFADHFGEPYRRDMCNGMCDVCARGGTPFFPQARPAERAPLQPARPRNRAARRGAAAGSPDVVLID